MAVSLRAGRPQRKPADTTLAVQVACQTAALRESRLLLHQVSDAKCQQASAEVRDRLSRLQLMPRVGVEPEQSRGAASRS